MILSLLITLLSGTAQASQPTAQCAVRAQAAVNGLAKLNHVRLTKIRLQKQQGPVETYTAGAFVIEMNTGSDDYADCAIMSVDFNPQP